MEKLIYPYRSYSYFKELFWVVGAHFFIASFFIINFPKVPFKKIPPISIEIGAAPPPSSGVQSPLSQKSVSEAKTSKPSQKKDKDGVQSLPYEQSPPIITGSSSVGPAAAKTSDAKASFNILKNVKPAYPPLAYRMRLEGTVTLLVELLPTGRVGVVNVAKSSGSELLDRSALDAVKLWEFSVLESDGKSQFIKIPITFSLKK